MKLRTFLTSTLAAAAALAFGGTFLQCAAPVVTLALFVRQAEYFGAAFCPGWLGMNLYSVATYMADARELDLPLVSIGGGDSEIGHDWNYMLAELHLLDYDTKLAGLVRLAAFLCLWGSVLVMSAMLVKMARSPEPARR